MLVEKLVLLIPPPKSHLVRWGGVFAFNSPYRSSITLRPSVKKGFQFGEASDEVDQEAKGSVKVKNYSWSAMLKKVFKIDTPLCTACGGDMRKIAAITNPMEVRRYLKHVNMDYEPPAPAHPRMVQGELDLEEEVNKVAVLTMRSTKVFRPTPVAFRSSIPHRRTGPIKKQLDRIRSKYRCNLAK